MNRLPMALLAALAGALAEGEVGESPACRFRSEVVVLRVDETAFSVDGLYDFEFDHGARSQPIFYPIPFDEASGRPHVESVVRIDAEGGSVPLEFVHERDGVRFVLDPAPRVSLRVRYRQPTRAFAAHYVLRSTRRWGQPLVRSTLRVEVPANQRFDLRPPLAHRTTRSSRTIYESTFRDWMPTEDLRVTRRHP